MAEKQEIPESIIEFPVEKLEYMNGFSMDFGVYCFLQNNIGVYIVSVNLYYSNCLQSFRSVCSSMDIFISIGFKMYQNCN